MKYIVQINTGSIDTLNYDHKQVIERLDYLSDLLPINKVIVGWNKDYLTNKKIIDFLKNKNIESYFWLPIFSEITDLTKEDKYVEAKIEKQEEMTFYGEDNFEFVCQSSIKNIEYVLNRFDEIKKDCEFDGIFIDRIRYPSPAISKSAIYGCQCERCKKIYQEAGINLDALLNKSLDDFVPVSFEDGHYVYENKDINTLMRIKRDTITNAVKVIKKACDKRNLKLGIDTFALEISDFVGQDILALKDYVDFVKPMNYLCTIAPAGIPFEVDGLGENINIALENIWNNETRNIQGSIKQFEVLKQKGINATIGIDCNFVDKICHSNKDYVLQHVNALKQAGATEVVLSWNAMLLDDDLISELKNID